jgi:hypothetical protein
MSEDEKGISPSIDWVCRRYCTNIGNCIGDSSLNIFIKSLVITGSAIENPSDNPIVVTEGQS